MTFNRSVIVFLLLVGVTVFLIEPAAAQTRIGLHVTQEELNIWRQRAQSGPYRVSGDVSSNSPGDWTRVTQRANSFANNPNAEIWPGNDSGKPVYANGTYATCSYGNPCVPGNLQGRMILNAAFAWLVDPTNHNHVAAVRRFFLDQIAQPGTDFTNTTLWPDYQIGDGWFMGATNFLTRLVFAYSYVRNSSVFSSQERLNIDTWFSNAAYYWAKQTDFIVRSGQFPKRNEEYDTSVALGSAYPTAPLDGTQNAGSGKVTHFACTENAPGRLSTTFQEPWNNRSASLIRFAAAGSLINGTLTKDAQTQRWVKMWVKERFIYATFPDNTVKEYSYWLCATNVAMCGWGYSGLAIGSLVTVADLFARRGDPWLYTFSTTAGVTWSQTPNANTTGGPKSLQRVIQRHASLVNQRATSNPNWVAFGDNSKCGGDRLNWLVQPADTNGEQRIAEQNFLPSNVFYRDTAYKAAYMRTSNGAPPYPSNPSNYQDPWAGEWGVYPAPLFMFGQMEGKIWPYSTGGSQVAPNGPTNLVTQIAE